jgi:aldose 1-epimerase
MRPSPRCPPVRLPPVRYAPVGDITLRAGDYEVAFRPDRGMLCASLQYRNEEYVAWPRTITDFRAGSATAIPIVHPWVNRLGAWEYTAAGQHVDLRGQQLPTDTNGLPIHGNLYAAPFEVLRAEPSRVVTRFDYGAHPDKLCAFPFPHTLTIDARLHATTGLTLATEVAATSTTPVPVSFGWHPYLKLPAGGRSAWDLTWPACEHIEVDAHIIPTGVRTPIPAERAPIGRRTFDDHYALGADRTFAISGAGRSLRLTFGDAYPFAQLFVPPRRQLVAIEPMSAEIDALGRGIAPLCAPGEVFRAEFTIDAAR